MQITFLGTGTSHGIPVIGCECPVCSSTDPRNTRLRSSLLIEQDGLSVVIDTGPDFRMQALTASMRHLDAVFYTHDHADHLYGIDDLRVFSRDHALKVYSSERTLSQIRSRFSYMFEDEVPGGGVPALDLRTLGTQGIDVGSLHFQAVPVYHGSKSINGYRFGSAAYLTDCSGIPEESYGLLEDLDVLILGALRYTTHPTHFSVAEALETIRRIRPRRAYLTHMCHDLEHEKLLRTLPEGVRPAFDRLRISLPMEES